MADDGAWRSSNVVSLEEIRAERARFQERVDADLCTPDSVDAARDIATHMTTEDGKESRGVGLYPPPDGKVWSLTPDQADELALSLVRSAALARSMGGKLR